MGVKWTYLKVQILCFGDLVRRFGHARALSTCPITMNGIKIWWSWTPIHLTNFLTFKEIIDSSLRCFTLPHINVWHFSGRVLFEIQQSQPCNSERSQHSYIEKSWQQEVNIVRVNIVAQQNWSNIIFIIFTNCIQECSQRAENYI